jgi:hypothetical protein
VVSLILAIGAFLLLLLLLRFVSFPTGISAALSRTEPVPQHPASISSSASYTSLALELGCCALDVGWFESAAADKGDVLEKSHGERLGGMTQYRGSDSEPIATLTYAN